MGDVLNDVTEWEVRAVDALVVVLGAGVQLGPDPAIVFVHDLKGGDDLGFGQVTSVGDQNQLNVGGAVLTFQVGCKLHGVEEDWTGGGLPVAAEGDIVDPPQCGWGVGELRLNKEAPCGGGGQQRLQFAIEDIQVDVAHARGDCPVYLTIYAVEVAGGVRVEVDADAEASTSSGEDGIDVVEAPPIAWMVVKISVDGIVGGLDREISVI